MERRKPRAVQWRAEGKALGKFVSACKIGTVAERKCVGELWRLER